MELFLYPRVFRFCFSEDVWGSPGGNLPQTPIRLLLCLEPLVQSNWFRQSNLGKYNEDLAICQWCKAFSFSCSLFHLFFEFLDTGPNCKRWGRLKVAYKSRFVVIDLQGWYWEMVYSCNFVCSEIKKWFIKKENRFNVLLGILLNSSNLNTVYSGQIVPQE